MEQLKPQELDALDGGVAASQATFDGQNRWLGIVGMRTIRPSLSGHSSNSGGGLGAWRAWLGGKLPGFHKEKILLVVSYILIY